MEPAHGHDEEELIEREALMRWGDEAPTPPQCEDDEDVLYTANPAHKRRGRTRRIRQRVKARRR